MNQEISECEQSINDLDNASLDNFAAVGTDVEAVQKQIDDLEVCGHREPKLGSRVSILRQIYVLLVKPIYSIPQNQPTLGSVWCDNMKLMGGRKE